MKRPLYLLLVVGVAAALAGWMVARARAPYREQEFAEQAKIAAENRANERAKGRAKYFAGLVREADEAVILNEYGNSRREVRLSDPAWLARLADILGSALYTPTAHGMWVSTPEIRLYRNKTEILNLTTFGGILRAYGEHEKGDYRVGKEVTDAILALAREKEVPSVEK